MMGPKTGLKRPKRACETATVARRLWPFRRSRVALLQVRCAFPQVRCGPFASLAGRNGENGGLLRRSKGSFPLRLEDFGGCSFVHIIRHHPMACRDSLRRACGCVGHARTRFPPAVNCPHSPVLRVAASRLSPHIRCGLERGRAIPSFVYEHFTESVKRPDTARQRFISHSLTFFMSSRCFSLHIFTYFCSEYYTLTKLACTRLIKIEIL